MKILLLMSICAQIGQVGEVSTMSVEALLREYGRGQELLRVRSDESTLSMTYRDSSFADVLWSRHKLKSFNDGDRLDIDDISWSGWSQTKSSPLMGEPKNLRRVIWDGNAWYNYYRSPTEKSGTLNISTSEEHKVDHLRALLGPVTGKFSGDHQPFTEILSGAENATVRKATREGDTSECYVIDAETNSGVYQVWLDPSKGFNIVKAHVRKTGDDMLYGEPMSTDHEDVSTDAYVGKLPFPPQRDRAEFVFNLDHVELEEINGVWVTVGAEYSNQTTYEDGRTTRNEATYGRSQVNFSPDFQKAGAFVPNFPEGTSTWNIDKPRVLVDTNEKLELTIRKPPLQAGQDAPEFTCETLDGETISLADYRGKYVLLDFWSVWCGPCRGETPHLKAVWDAFGDDDRFAMIGLSLDKDVDVPKEYTEKNELKWIQGFLGDWSKTKVPASFGVQGIPSIILIGPDGKIIASGLRGPAIKAAVDAALGNSQ